MKPGLVHTPGPPQGTIEDATHTRTPSQAEHGLEGVLLSRGGSQVGEIACRRMQPNASPRNLHLGLITLMDSHGCDISLDECFAKIGCENLQCLRYWAVLSNCS